MINGSTEIIAGVPGKNLDPILLAQSQTTDSINLMVITYNIVSHLTTEKHYDLLFLQGSRIFDSARMNEEFRFHLQVEKIIATFKSHSSDDGTRIHFYDVSRESIEQFRSTFYYEPCLNIKLESLTRKQLQRLLSSSNSHHCIIEHNDFSQAIPKILLQEIHSSSELENYIPISLKGRLLLYDIDRNNQFIHERFDSNINVLPLQSSSTPKQADTFIVRKDESDDSRQRQSSMLNEANQITDLINQILHTPEPQQEPKGTLKLEFHEEVKDADSIQTQTSTKTHTKPKDTRNTKRPLSPARPHRPSLRKPDNTISEDNAEQYSNIISLFEGILRSCRKVIFELLGEKSDTIITNAENQVRSKHPDFKLSELTEANAIIVLNILEIVIRNIPLFKRSRIRKVVMQLIADAYNKQYELLERAKVLERFEQFYYELKK